MSYATKIASFAMKADDLDWGPGEGLHVFAVHGRRPLSVYPPINEVISVLCHGREASRADDHEADFVNTVQVTSPSEPVSADGGVGRSD